MARVIITGGAGFIGSHLSDLLINEGHEVICVDNLFTGRKENLKEVLQNQKFEFVRHDVTQPILLEGDVVFHLACPASPVHYQHNPVKTVKTNVIGTINMLGLAKRVGAKFLLASTSEVYGDPLEHPQKESYWGHVNPIGPRSCYDEGKRVAETLVMNYRLQHNLNAKIVRIFNTYGPRMLFNDGRVVSNFIVQALNGEPITIYGDGSQTRSFCYIDDLIRGFIACMKKDNFYGPVNLGNPVEITIKELAEIILDMTGSKSKLIQQPLPKDDPTRRNPDITLAKTELGWEPKITLRAGLARTIEDFEMRLKAGEEWRSE
ncbi:MAG: UDP-glucuronic acid decarboxylase family protein [Bdellovibrionota bacterium]|jgi:UDP-glucuronate decarboxylase